jgi:hypothetical protein
MKEVKLKRQTLLLYDDIDQLPIEVFNKVNKYWMLHDNIGSSFEDIDSTHLSKLFLLINNPEKLKKELENLRILIYNVINEVNPRHMAFAALIFSIDGKEITDRSDEGLKRTLKMLDITEGELKKKTKK